MRKIIGFGMGTVAVVALAAGVQIGTTSGQEDKQPPAISSSASQDPTGSTSPTPGVESTMGKDDDGEREGSTTVHTGKPGENK